MLVGQKRSMSLDRLFRVESGDSEQRLPPPLPKKTYRRDLVSSSENTPLSIVSGDCLTNKGQSLLWSMRRSDVDTNLLLVTHLRRHESFEFSGEWITK